jgi:quinol monooxygenase YgiN
MLSSRFLFLIGCLALAAGCNNQPAGPAAGTKSGPSKSTLSLDQRASLVVGDSTPFHILVAMEVPAKHESRFVYLANQAQAATRLESGCLSYTFFRDAEKTGSYHLFETWSNAQALQAHLQTPHTVEFITFAMQVAKVDVRVLRPLQPGEGNLDQLPAQLPVEMPVQVPVQIPAPAQVPVQPAAAPEVAAPALPTPPPPAPEATPLPPAPAPAEAKTAPKVVRPRP